MKRKRCLFEEDDAHTSEGARALRSVHILREYFGKRNNEEFTEMLDQIETALAQADVSEITLLTLPDVIFMRILFFLDDSAYTMLSRTCKAMRGLLNQDMIATRGPCFRKIAYFPCINEFGVFEIKRRTRHNKCLGSWVGPYGQYFTAEYQTFEREDSGEADKRIIVVRHTEKTHKTAFSYDFFIFQPDVQHMFPCPIYTSGGAANELDMFGTDRRNSVVFTNQLRKAINTLSAQRQFGEIVCNIFPHNPWSSCVLLNQMFYLGDGSQVSRFGEKDIISALNISIRKEKREHDGKEKTYYVFSYFGYMLSHMLFTDVLPQPVVFYKEGDDLYVYAIENGILCHGKFCEQRFDMNHRPSPRLPIEGKVLALAANRKFLFVAISRPHASNPFGGSSTGVWARWLDRKLDGFWFKIFDRVDAITQNPLFATEYGLTSGRDVVFFK